jgi:hypothetical protein
VGRHRHGGHDRSGKSRWSDGLLRAATCISEQQPVGSPCAGIRSVLPVKVVPSLVEDCVFGQNGLLADAVRDAGKLALIWTNCGQVLGLGRSDRARERLPKSGRRLDPQWRFLSPS